MCTNRQTSGLRPPVTGSSNATAVCHTLDDDMESTAGARLHVNLARGFLGPQSKYDAQAVKHAAMSLTEREVAEEAACARAVN